jgi:hypothetical protein
MSNTIALILLTLALCCLILTWMVVVGYYPLNRVTIAVSAILAAIVNGILLLIRAIIKIPADAIRRLRPVKTKTELADASTKSTGAGARESPAASKTVFGPDSRTRARARPHRTDKSTSGRRKR